MMGDDLSLDIRQFVKIIKKYKWTIIALTMFTTLTSGLFSFYLTTPSYKTDISIIVGKTGLAESTNFNGNDDLIITYIEIANFNTVASKASENLNGKVPPEKISKFINISSKEKTPIITITSVGDSPQQAVDLVNGFSKAFIEEAINIYPNISIDVLDKAHTPLDPVKDNTKTAIIVGFLAGFLASIGIVLLINYTDSKFKTEKEIEIYLKLPVIGNINRYRKL